MPKLQPFLVTIRIFNPDDGGTIALVDLPVDSPDAEHAAASTLANAVSFTPKTSAAGTLPVAFCALAVKPRPPG